MTFTTFTNGRTSYAMVSMSWLPPFHRECTLEGVHLVPVLSNNEAGLFAVPTSSPESLLLALLKSPPEPLLYVLGHMCIGSADPEIPGGYVNRTD